jgi:hypothetical protein
MSNICVLLWFFHDYLERCRRVSAHRRNRSRLARLVATLPARSRPIRHFTNYLSRWSRRDEFLLDAQSYLLPIQVDKLLGDVRSFLSSIYQVAQVFTPPGYLVKVPKNERFRESFGPFADRYEEGKLPPLVWPLTLLEELVPWGQTVRSLRDNYVHHGKSSIAMPRFEVPKGAAQVYFDLHGFSKRPGQRDLPDALYATDNPNDLLDLELLVLYIVVPVFALRHALGEPLQEHHSRGLSGWKPMGGSPLAGGGGISALGVMLQRRLEVVDTELYRFRRPKPAPKVK